MRKNFGGSLNKVEAMKAEAFFIEEAVNLLSIASPQVRGFSQKCPNYKQTADGVTSIPL